MSAADEPTPWREPGPIETRRSLAVEVVILLVVTFGTSAITAVLRLVDAVLRDLASQRAVLNPRRSYYDAIDLGLNLAYAAQLFAWGALALYLLHRGGITASRVGLGRFSLRRDGLGGLALAAAIGIPGLALYIASRHLGTSVDVVPSGLDDSWWRVPMLVVSSAANGFAEEVVVVGYLLTRLRQLGVRPVPAIAASAALRGAYHLYQGFGGGLGNVVMGVVFGWLWHRTGRLWPLVVAHTVIDVVALVGYALLAGPAGWLP